MRNSEAVILEMSERTSQHAADILIIVEDIHRVVATVILKVDDLICGRTEDEHIVLADFLCHLDVRC